MKVGRWVAVSVVLSILLVASLYGCYSSIRMPSTRTWNTVDLQYLQSADYSYTAHIKPSLLYDNRTKLSTGETLYIKLVEQLNVTFQYNLTQSPISVEMTDAVLKCEASATIRGGGWTKTYLLRPRTTEPLSFVYKYALNLEEIRGIVEMIGEETGMPSHTYSYEIRHHIHLQASAGGKPIKEDFTPILTIRFGGGTIEFEGLRNQESGTVTHREWEVATWRLLGWTMAVPSMQAASMIASMCFAALLVASVRLTLVERASRPFLERLSGDIREKIIEASEPPKRIARATIKVGSLEDLGKVSEETFKPIIHYGDIFYVLDGDVRYEFTFEENKGAVQKT